MKLHCKADFHCKALVSSMPAVLCFMFHKHLLTGCVGWQNTIVDLVLNILELWGYLQRGQLGCGWNCLRRLRRRPRCPGPWTWSWTMDALLPGSAEPPLTANGSGGGPEHLPAAIIINPSGCWQLVSYVLWCTLHPQAQPNADPSVTVLNTLGRRTLQQLPWATRECCATSPWCRARRSL